MKVLVVDDNKNDRMLLSKMLHKNIYEVKEAGNGVEALEQIERGTPDIMISDIMMLHMDGFMPIIDIRKKRSK
ncbi:MAG: response regulator [Candidatus Methanoperedens sp.]|nr:response regulator [Candidatus Methanoperedens sp.]